MPVARQPQPPGGSGVAAALLAAMLGEGVDINDKQAINTWIGGFNRRDRSERDLVLSDELLAGMPNIPGMPGIPGNPGSTAGAGGRAYKIALPTEESARASAASSPLLGQLKELVAFLGDGRKVTQTGALTVADGRSLVALLNTGDRLDPAIGDKVYKTRSAADLPNLSFIVRVASAARFVRVVKGKITSTKAGKSLGRQPLDDLRRLVAGIDDVGVVSARLANARWVYGSLAPFFDDMFVNLCMTVLSADSGVAFTVVVAAAFEQFQEEIDTDNPYWTEEFRHDVVEHEMRTAIETLEAAGTVTWSAVASPETRSRRTAGTITTTPAGQWALSRYLSEQHGVAFAEAQPVRFSDLTFEALVIACEQDADLDAGDVVREIAAWIVHQEDNALSALIHTVRNTDDPAIRQMALAAMGEHLGDSAEPAVRGLLDDNRLRASALLWLVRHGAEATETLVDPDPSVFSEILGLVFVGGGPDAMIELFEIVGQHDDQIAAINRLWRITTPTAGPVLATLGRHHPVKAVAKAARKAALQHSSFVANQRR